MKKEYIIIKIDGKNKERFRKIAVENGKTMSGAIRDAMLDYELEGGPRSKVVSFK